MKLIGITRIRNESNIIENTLNHVSKLVDEIHVFDDASEDNTIEICQAHPAVTTVIEGKTWANTPKGRALAEGQLRTAVYKSAVEAGADWVYYFDSDEYVYFDETLDLENATSNSYFFRLFDFYITEEDKEQHYLERKWMGPEYRDIPMLFKVDPEGIFRSRVLTTHRNPKFGGYVKHYGKAISVEEWEKTCEYYINYRWKTGHSELLKRWKERVGKAIHTMSDFNRPLIQWDERKNEELIIKIK